MPNGAMRKHQAQLIMGWHPAEERLGQLPSHSVCALSSSLPQTSHFSLCFSLHGGKTESIIMSSALELFTIKKKIIYKAL